MPLTQSQYNKALGKVRKKALELLKEEKFCTYDDARKFLNSPDAGLAMYNFTNTTYGSGSLDAAKLHLAFKAMGFTDDEIKPCLFNVG